MKLLCETNLDTIKAVIDREKPQIVVIDSIQTMFNEEVSSAPGRCITGARVHRCFDADRKGNGNLHFHCGTCDERGSGGWTRVLEHMVDTVLYFEGDRHAAYRILRGVKTVLVPQMRSVCLRCGRTVLWSGKSVRIHVER